MSKYEVGSVLLVDKMWDLCLIEMEKYAGVSVSETELGIGGTTAWKLCTLNGKKSISFNLKCWMHYAPIQQLQGLHPECCLWLNANTVNPCSSRYGVMAMEPECLLSISMCSTSFSSPKMVVTFWKANVSSLMFCIHQGMVKQRNNITFYGSLLSLIFPFVQSLPFETAGPLGCILPL